MNELSIVIVNWNSWPFLRSCLDSIYSSPSEFPFEVIVVDNGSSDGGRESLMKEFGGIRLIANSVNIGFAAANNQGADLAKGRYLLFLNPDTKILAGTLDGAVAFMEQHPEAGIMGCRTLNRDGSLQATAFVFPGKLRVFAYVSGLNRIFKLSRFKDHSALCTPDYVQGSFLIIRKDLFNGSGRFDERFFLYAEEVDLCMRVRQKGFQVYYYPDISIIHHGGGSSRNSLVALSHFIESHILLHQKYRTQRQVGRLLVALKLALRLRFVLELLFSPLHFRERGKTIGRLLRDVPIAGREGSSGHAS